VQRRPWLALGGGLALLVLLALPFLGVRYGFPDAGNDRAGTTTRQAYDLLADGFGPGANGPLLLVSQDDGSALAQVRERVAGTPGVAAVIPPQAAPGGGAAMMTVLPASSPQSADTERLVARCATRSPAPASTSAA
jgi:RND superfamily putative drug exporter